MSSFCLTQKDLLELKFWLTADLAAAREKAQRYLHAFNYNGFKFDSVLEIGTGPLWGLLPRINARHKVGCDPLYPVFEAVGLLAENPGIERVNKYFDQWVPSGSETFDAIFTTDALDHGEMGFDLIPKMAGMLRPGGWLAIHVHLRPSDLLNLIHDHALTLDQLTENVSKTNLDPIVYDLHEKDIDGQFCPALVGVWQNSNDRCDPNRHTHR